MRPGKTSSTAVSIRFSASARFFPMAPHAEHKQGAQMEQTAKNTHPSSMVMVFLLSVQLGP